MSSRKTPSGVAEDHHLARPELSHVPLLGLTHALQAELDELLPGLVDVVDLEREAHDAQVEG
jgi:hypothetical protein